MRKNLFYVMLAGTVLLSACKTMPQIGAQIGTQMETVGSQVGAQIGAQIGVGSEIGTQVGAQVGAQIGTQVGAAIPMGASGVGTINGRYVVEIVECTGHTTAQNVTAVAVVTNQGPNARCNVGGYNASLAIDAAGNTYEARCYQKNNCQYDLPTNVPVRIPVTFEPVLPNVTTFRVVRINVCRGDNSTVDLHLIPVTWVN